MAFIAHFTTLVNKNFIRWKRGWLCSLCELITPIGFVCLLFLAYDPEDIIEVDQHSNLPDDVYSLKALDAELIDWPDYLISFENPWGRLLQEDTEGEEDFEFPEIDTKKLLPRDIKVCEHEGTVLGLSPTSSNLAQKIAQQFDDQVSIIPVKFFDDEEAMEEYMQASEYLGNDYPGICMGISIIEEGNGQYNYNLKFNFTWGRFDETIYPQEKERLSLEQRQFLLLILVIYLEKEMTFFGGMIIMEHFFFKVELIIQFYKKKLKIQMLKLK